MDEKLWLLIRIGAILCVIFVSFFSLISCEKNSNQDHYHPIDSFYFNSFESPSDNLMLELNSGGVISGAMLVDHIEIPKRKVFSLNFQIWT